MTKKILKIAAYAVGCLLFLAVVLAGFTQTKLFKDRLRHFLISAITTNTNATLSLGTIRGNFVTGFTIDSLALRIGEENFVSTGQVGVSYDLFSLLRKKIIINRLTLDAPAVLLERGADGQWNIRKLARPGPASPESSSFDWTIQVDELKINDGTFILRDPIALASPEHEPSLPHQVEYHDLHVSGITLDCGGRYVERSAHLLVRGLSFESRSPRFALRQFRGEFSISPKGAEATSMEIRTADSRIKISAALLDFNLFDGIRLEDLERKPTRVTMVADAIDLNELKSFIPQIDFLNGAASLELDARGAFGDLTINRLNLRTYGTSLKVTGSIQNLHRPHDLFIQASIHDSHVIPGDANKLLPPFNIPSFERAGPLQLDAQFSGTPLHFTARVSTSGEMGDLQAESALDLRNKPMTYAGVLRSRNFLISKFFDFPEGTVLSGAGTFNGTGTSLRSMTASARMALDSSVVQSMMLSESEIRVEARGGKLKSTVKLASRDARLSLDANADFADSAKTSFDAEADIAGLDLAKILDDPQHQSNLSFHASLSGTGSDLESLTGRASLIFSTSSYQAHDFESAVVTCSFDQRDPLNKSLELASPVADVRLTGTFSLEDLVEQLNHEYRGLAATARQRALLFEGNTFAMLPRGESSTSPFAMRYSILVKNLQAASLFLGGPPFNGRGFLEGSISWDGGVFVLTCSTSVNELFIGTVERGMFIDDGTGFIELISRQPDRPQATAADYVDGLSLNLKTRVASGTANTHTFENSFVEISLQQGTGRVEMRSRVDSLATISTVGTVQMGEQAYTVVLDTLTALFRSVVWNSEKDIAISVDRTGLRVSDVELRRGKERITLRGVIRSNGAVDAAFALRRIDLSGLGEYSGAKQIQGERGFSGNLDLDLDVQGTTAAPRMRLTSDCANFGYRGRQAGSLRGLLRYENQNLDIEFRLKNAVDGNPQSDLNLYGNLPIDLAFGSVEKRFPEDSMSLTLSSERFDAGLLDPMIASVDGLWGTISCDVRIQGTPNNPVYTGAITSPEVRFMFVPNNLMYILKGRLEASGDRINLASIEISNNPDDQRGARATVEGSLIVRNFAVESFDLTANGRLLLLKESSRRTAKSMYGRLFAAIGSDGLKFRGSFNRSYLTGSIYIREASLVFPPTTEDANSAGETSLNYIVVDDTSTTDALKERLTEQFYSTDGKTGNESTKAATQRQEVRTVWDGMEYDIQIETQGTTEIRMIFNQATNEELFAELEGKVFLQDRRQRGAQLSGEIAISQRSYYNFFKRFGASGTLKFVGQPDNPELNITATYEGTGRPPGVKADTTSPEQKVVVILTITGTRYEPKINISMTVDGEDWAEKAKGGDVESDAISFILTGKFRDDLTSREKSDLATSVGASAGASLLYGLPSQMLSGALSEFLRSELGFIHSAEVSYLGGSLQETADLRLSGELGRAYWRFGGKIFNDIGNANVSFQLSMGEVLSTPQLRNLFIEVERRVEGTEYIDQRKLTNAARIFYRFSF